MLYKVPRIKFSIKKEHLQTLYDTVLSGEFVIGNALKQFATLLCNHTKKKYCILTTNGFSALFIAIKSLGWSNKKIALPAASTCFAIFNAIKASGNIPVFIDNNLSTGNICFDALEENIQKRKVNAAILPSHFGILNDRGKMGRLTVPVIEDNAQAILSTFCFSSPADAICFSFYPTKVLNAIDGGAILTDIKDVADNAKDIVYYAHQVEDDSKIRYNLRMNNLNAAFGCVTLRFVEELIEIFHKIKTAYLSVLKLFPFVKVLGANTNQVLSRFVLRFPDKNSTLFFEKEMLKKGIEVSREFMILDKTNVSLYPNAKVLTETTLSIPFRDSLSNEEVEYVQEVLSEVLSKISGGNS